MTSSTWMWFINRPWWYVIYPQYQTGECQQGAQSDVLPLLAVSSATVRKADARSGEQIDVNGQKLT